MMSEAGPDSTAVRLEAARLVAQFEARGAERVEADILQPAETLLDLYGEDIRARAYVTDDPIRGEAMLRPDFTVPVTLAHLAAGGGAARYTYAGKVFRKQEELAQRASEYTQVGYEVFGGDDPARAEAEVFVLFRDILDGLPLTAATGDIGLLTAAVQALRTTPARKAALMRHVWRPRRFRALLERFGTARPPRRFPEATAPQIGLRRQEEITARIAALAEDAATPPIGRGEIDSLEALMGLRETAVHALAHLRDLAVDTPALEAATDRFARRLEALSDAGVDVARLDFEASYGRTSMEYYDGFVFGFYAAARPDLPPAATGGRYDALTRALGGTAQAVGGVLRPRQLLDLGGRA